MVLKLKHNCSCCTKTFALIFWWTSTNKITGTQHHHKLVLSSSCHVQRVLVIATKVEQGKIRVGNKWLLMITGAQITRTVTQKSRICHHQIYLFLPHWIIQSCTVAHTTLFRSVCATVLKLTTIHVPQIESL